MNKLGIFINFQKFMRCLINTAQEAAYLLKYEQDMLRKYKML